MAQMRVHDGTTERDYWQRLMPDAVEKYDHEVRASTPAPLTLAVSSTPLP